MDGDQLLTVMSGHSDYSERVRRQVVNAIRVRGLREHQVATLVKGRIARSTLQRRLAGAPFTTSELEALADALDVPVQQFGAPPARMARLRRVG